MNIFTIGFSGKTAEVFFMLLVRNKVKKLIDIRLNNKSQLAGFTNNKHLPYLLKIHNIEYKYMPELAPTNELLNSYKKNKISWKDYEKIYNDILTTRKIKDIVKIEQFADAVLLCSEPIAEQCHRRLLAEYLYNNFENIQIKHL